ncbi:hypothetical protein LXL04_019920 [Taraxacum kok-saghyz]
MLVSIRVVTKVEGSNSGDATTASLFRRSDRATMSGSPVINDSSPPSSSSIDISNPYYLGSSDNPGTVLVSNVFSGTGFSAWKRSMIIALSAKNKIGFVDGTVSQPAADSSNYASWYKVNSMVISWFLNSLHQNIAESVLFLQTASEIWKELHHRYEQTDGALIYQVQQQLYSLPQGSDDFSVYFTKIMKI